MATYAKTKGVLLHRSSDNRPRTLSGSILNESVLKDWKPLRPCICVTEPCPCDTLDDLIVWLPAEKKGRSTGKRSTSDEVVAFDMEPDETVIVELQLPMTAAQLRQLKEWSTREGGNGVRAKAGGGKGKKPLTPAQAAAAVFAVGYALGEKIDEASGLSDKISDWAADHIPWPF